MAMQSTVRDFIVDALEDLESRQLRKFQRKLTDMNIDEKYKKIPRGRLENAEADRTVDIILEFYGESYGCKLTFDVLNHINERQVAENLRKNVEKIKSEQGTSDVFHAAPNENCGLAPSHASSEDMKSLFLEPSSDILSYKMARVYLDETTPEFSTLTEEGDNISPSVHGKTYRLELKPGQLVCCSETGIKFQVKSPVTIEYELEYGKDYMKQIKDSGYELVGPLFNITVEPGVVSTVHLPHYLHLEGLGKDKSSIKYGHFKDGKVHFKSPTSINSSYIVLDNPTFSRAGAMFRLTSFWTQRKKSIPISGMVLLYFCVVSPHLEKVKEYRTHLYLVACNKVDLKELDKKKTKNGFQMIDKPPVAKLIAGNTYTVTIEKTEVKPLFLKFEINKEFQNLDFMEINVKGNAKSISLSLAAVEDKDTTVWSGELTEADLEHQSVRMLRRFKETDESNTHFVMKHRKELIEKINPINPIIDDLHEDLLTEEQYDNVRSKPTSYEMMRELYGYVRCWGEDGKDKFYGVLKKHYPKIISALKDNS